MNIIHRISTWFGKKPQPQQPPTAGAQIYKSESGDPNKDPSWRSTPHNIGITIPSMADAALETTGTVHAHEKGIDAATGAFMFPLIDAEADATGVAIEERHLDQIRTEQGLWAEEAAQAQQSRNTADLLRTQLDRADADFRAGRDALLGIPGTTPAWDTNLSHEINLPTLPIPGSSLTHRGSTTVTTTPATGASTTNTSWENTGAREETTTEAQDDRDTQQDKDEQAA